MTSPNLLDLSSRYQRRILWGIFWVSLSLSLLHSFYYRIEPIVDAARHDVIARNIAAGTGYRANPEKSILEDRGIKAPGPGYEYFLAAIYRLFGFYYGFVWVVQGLLHALTALAVFYLARFIFCENWHPAIGIGSAFLIAFSPDLIIGNGMLLTETLAIFLLVCFLIVFFYSPSPNTPRLAAGSTNKFHYWRNSSFVSAAVSGFLFGASFLVRAQLGILLLPALFLFFWKRKFIHAVLFLVVFAAALTPWVIRNYNVYGAFVPASVNFGDNLLAGNYPLSSGELDDGRYEFNSEFRGYDVITADSLMAKAAFSYIAANPLRFLKITFYRASIYFSFARPTGWWPYLAGLDRYFVLGSSAIYAFILFVLGGAGLWNSLKNSSGEQKRKIWMLASMLVSMPISIIFFIVETRYRYPVYPFFAVFAGYAVYKLIAERGAIMKPLLISLTIILANGLFDIIRNLDRILDRIGSI